MILYLRPMFFSFDLAADCNRSLRLWKTRRRGRKSKDASKTWNARASSSPRRPEILTQFSWSAEQRISFNASHGEPTWPHFNILPGTCGTKKKLVLWWGLRTAGGVFFLSRRGLHGEMRCCNYPGIIRLYVDNEDVSSLRVAPELAL